MKRDLKLFLKDIIIDAMNAIEEFVKGIDLNKLMKDDKTSSAVIRKFEVIGEAARNILDWVRKNIQKFHGHGWRE